MKLVLVKLLWLLCSLPLLGLAQSISADSTFFPDKINLTPPFSIAFPAEMKQPANSSDILYAIAGARHYEGQSYIKLRIPQFLTIEQVIRQCLLYFNFLDSEHEKENTELLIYPLFIAVQDSPYLTVRFEQGDICNIHCRAWPLIEHPPKPPSADIDVYNLLIERAMKQALSVDSISTAVYSDIAGQTGKSEAEVRLIYQKVRLWSLKKISEK